jgi:hypothetical protein
MPLLSYWSQRPDPDSLLDERYFRIDTGRECPVCWQRITAREIVALGIDLYVCPACDATWVKP